MKFTLSQVVLFTALFAAVTGWAVERSRHQHTLGQHEQALEALDIRLNRWLPQSRTVTLATTWKGVHNSSQDYPAFDNYVDSELLWAIHEGFELRDALKTIDYDESVSICGHALDLLRLNSPGEVRKSMIKVLGADHKDAYPFLLDSGSDEFEAFDEFIADCISEKD